MPVQVRDGGSHDSAQIHQIFFVDLVKSEQIRVVAKVVEKPVEFPKRAFSTVKTS